MSCGEGDALMRRLVGPFLFAVLIALLAPPRAAMACPS
jgi:hypothetical protein